MKTTSVFSSWDTLLIDPTQNRESKPRTAGLTMVIDKGMGPTSFRDLLELAAEYIDFIKLGFGTAGLTPLSVLQEKLHLARHYGVTLYPGGTFFEVAHTQNRFENYLESLLELGFTWVEISDGTIFLPATDRSHVIHRAQRAGFKVITEIGKKEAGSVTPVPILVETFYRDREDGADYVIVEGRESGKNIGIYNQKGDVDTSYVEEVKERIASNHLIWEAPQKSQQVNLIKLMGPHTNLGNIPPSEVLPIESLRRGLRSDTFELGVKDIEQ